MPILYGEPYQQVKWRQIDELIIRITKEPFDNVKPRPGKSAITFEDCNIARLTIENEETIDFQDILISFSGCYIGEIEIENITSTNIGIALLRCLLGPVRINNTAIKRVLLHNNALLSTVVILKVHHVEISLAKDKMSLIEWKAAPILQYIGSPNFEEIVGQSQRYNLYSCESIQHKTDFTEAHDWFQFSLSITYGIEVADKETSISNAYLDTLTMSGSSVGNISLEAIRLNNFYISRFSATEKISFFNLNRLNASATDTKIQIHLSNMDNVWFDNVWFDRFGIVTLYRSKLSNTKFTGCIFPEDYSRFVTVENAHYPNVRSGNFDRDQYETFLQLKNALESTGNAYESYKFQALSLQALYRIRTLSRQDRFLLRLNDLSNRHGISIGRPFLWFLCLSILFYLGYLRSLGRLYWGGKFDSSLMGYYFSFLDITHRSDFLVDKKDLTGGALIIDYLSKVIFGYLIYQFIAAFRKYSKKTAS